MDNSNNVRNNNGLVTIDSVSQFTLRYYEVISGTDTIKIAE